MFGSCSDDRGGPICCILQIVAGYRITLHSSSFDTMSLTICFQLVSLLSATLPPLLDSPTPTTARTVCSCMMTAWPTPEHRSQTILVLLQAFTLSSTRFVPCNAACFLPWCFDTQDFLCQTCSSGSLILCEQVQ